MPRLRSFVAFLTLCIAQSAVVDYAGAVTLPSGFQKTTVFAGLDAPTAVQFASDGRVFVKVFASLSATTPTIFTDLRTYVHNYWDRGLLGLALHPNFPTTPYVYVLYTVDAPPGGTAPFYNDTWIFVAFSTT